MKSGTCTPDLRPSERVFIDAMRRLGFGRYEYLLIERGELVLDPWPTTVQGVKFGSDNPTACRDVPLEFELKRQAIELIDYVRSVDAGEIRCLEVRHGLPFSMEIEHRADAKGGDRG